MSLKSNYVKPYLELIAKYPDLAVTIDKVEEAKGHPETNLAHFGLTKKHLKRLEKMGYAILAHTDNGQGLVQKESGWFKQNGNGRKRRWILICRD